MLSIKRSFSQSYQIPQNGVFVTSSHQFTAKFQPVPFSAGDMCEPIIRTVLKQHFQLSLYPPRSTLNPFCPLCLKYVRPADNFMVSFQQYFQKHYLAHQQCLRHFDNKCLTTLLGENNPVQMIFSKDAGKTQFLARGQAQYYLQLCLSHNLSGKIYGRLNKKIKQNFSKQLVWDFRNNHEEGSYLPSVVAFPFPDFDLEIATIKLNDLQSRKTVKSFIDWGRLKSEEDRFVTFKNDDFELLSKIVVKKESKQKLIEDMNFKYKHPLDKDLPLIQLLKITVKINEEEEKFNFICGEQNSSITELLNQNTSESSDFSSIQSKNLLFASTDSVQRQNVDLPHLLKEEKLGQYVMNHHQSRNFQRFLIQATENEIDSTITALKGEFKELMTHQFANYMMQKLLNRCTCDQRLKIINELRFDLPSIALSTQGTHTLQSLVPLISTPEEISLIVEHLTPHFMQMAPSKNATHFIQKIVAFFPLTSTLTFFELALNNFSSFATDKNSICVLKRMMIKIKDSEKDNFHFLPKLKQNLMHCLLTNFDKIIQDAFGNYVVQFFFEYFGENYCLSIKNIILDKFRQYSLSKYSGNVVFKCINLFWDLNSVAERLRAILSNNVILDLYRHKEGNKILLAIMEKGQDGGLKSKIYNQLVLVDVSKFQRDKWTLILGCRSSTTATFSSFSEMMERPPRRKQP